MFLTKFVEKIKTLCKLNIFISENCAFYELMWKNMVSQTGHRRQYKLAHALCMLQDKGYAHAQVV